MPSKINSPSDYATRSRSDRNPVLLIHGITDTTIVFRTMSAYLSGLGGIDRVQRFISISAPNQGTLAAYLSRRPGCVQMRPDSAFLRDLNGDAAMLGRLNFTVIWTPYDLIIVPPRSSQMPVGKEVIVPARLHSWMLADKQCIKAVAAALSEPILAARASVP
jgi:triacylglycerol lipase